MCVDNALEQVNRILSGLCMLQGVPRSIVCVLLKYPPSFPQEIRFSGDLFAFNMASHTWRKLPTEVI